MKKISLLLVAFIMSMGMVMAQAPQRGERKQMDPKARAEKMTERMANEYGLNDTQKEKLLTLNTTMTEKMGDKPHGRKHRDGKAVKSEKKKPEAGKSETQKPENYEARKAEREKRMAAMKESREAYDAKVKEIFTEEQYNKYQTHLAERQQKHKEKAKDGRKDRHQRKERV